MALDWQSKQHREYVTTEELNGYIEKYFRSLEEYADWLSSDTAGKWTKHRKIYQGNRIKDAMLKEAVKGNVSAAQRLEIMEDGKRPVGRPKSVTYDERQSALKQEHDFREFAADVERLKAVK